MRTLIVSMRPRLGGERITQVRKMNDRHTETVQLQRFVKDIQRRATLPLRLVSYTIKGTL